MKPPTRAARLHRPSPDGQGGVTLIELVVVAASIAVLASIALPSYRSQVLRAQRTEARAALLALATAQEKFHLQCRHYATALDPGKDSDCATASLDFPIRSERGYYAVRITSADDRGWIAESWPTGPPQSADHSCQRFGLASSGRKRAWDAARRDNVRECWGR
jgi:type IV pilus assembly protein PilE